MDNKCETCRYNCVANMGIQSYNDGEFKNRGTATMEDKEKLTIPYIAHESEMARLERIIKRLWITVFVLLGIIVATNGAWLWYESQIEEISMTQEATTDGGGNAIVNGVASGDFYYGKSASDGQGEAQENRG